MNTALTTRPARQALLSGTARFGAAVAVAAALAASWIYAGQQSHDAVQASTAAVSHGTTYVTLPTVEIAARRDSAAVVAATASQRALTQ